MNYLYSLSLILFLNVACKADEAQSNNAQKKIEQDTKSTVTDQEAEIHIPESETPATPMTWHDAYLLYKGTAMCMAAECPLEEATGLLVGIQYCDTVIASGQTSETHPETERLRKNLESNLNFVKEHGYYLGRRYISCKDMLPLFEQMLEHKCSGSLFHVKQTTGVLSRVKQAECKDIQTNVLFLRKVFDDTVTAEDVLAPLRTQAELVLAHKKTLS